MLFFWALFSQAFNFRSYLFFTLVRQKKYIWETCDFFFFGRKAPTEDYRIPTERATINVFFGQWKPKTFIGKLRRGAGHYSTDLSGGLLLRKMPLEARKRTVLDKSPPIIDTAKADNLIGKKGRGNPIFDPWKTSLLKLAGDEFFTLSAFSFFRNVQ